MKTITAMEARRGFGAILDDVRLKSETYTLERAGKAVAMIIPIRDESSGSSNSKHSKLAIIKELAGLNAGSQRGTQVDQWLNNERENW